MNTLTLSVMNKVMYFWFLSTLLLAGCQEGTFVYTPPGPLTNAPSGSSRLTGPCQCALTHIVYDDCVPKPGWNCCPSMPIAHSVTGGIGFINNGGGGQIIMRGDISSSGCLDSINLTGMFHISIAEVDTQLIANDTVIIESHLFRNDDEISIAPIYRVQTEMNTMATIETDTITKNDYVISCKDDTLTANIIVDYGTISYSKGGFFDERPSYNLVVYIRDLHDIGPNEDCDETNPETLSDFVTIFNDTGDCHLKEHMMIVPIIFCETIRGKPLVNPINRKHH